MRVQVGDVWAVIRRTAGMLFVSTVAFVLASPAPEAREAEKIDAFHYNRLLGRGINLSNALDAPSEGAWGVTLNAEDFQIIKDAGFNSVRIPIRWSAHAVTAPLYLIDRAFFARVDWAIDQALSRNLVAIIDVHHFEEMDSAPEDSLPRLVAMWTQIAEHYRDYPDRLYFELMNEPHNHLTSERWQDIMPILLRVVRESNPTRTVVIGPAPWNDARYLDQLQLPDDDRNLIVTFHYYDPMPFTHQDTPWLEGSSAWKGTTWTDTAGEREALAAKFDNATAWAERNRRPLYLGEFGSTEAADMASRVRWTAAVIEESESRGISWGYWGFPWRAPVLEVLKSKR
jgi:endoglucanase